MRRKTDRFVIACTALCILCVAVVAVVSVTTLRTARETERVSRSAARSAASVNDLCDLVLNVHADRVRRYGNTLTYLRTPAGMEPTALNEYIREKSLPQTRDEVVKERRNLPPACTAGRELPEIPKQ